MDKFTLILSGGTVVFDGTNFVFTSTDGSVNTVYSSTVSTGGSTPTEVKVEEPDGSEETFVPEAAA